MLELETSTQEIETIEATAKEVVRESAAWDKRYWLRISNDCNLACIFCLDIEHHDGTYSNHDEVISIIDKAHAQGYTRLILSGGEATIHKDFIEFVAHASKLGFAKIQTVTNGRMFNYKSFTRKVVEAGLTEATFSIHGPDAKTHDMLVAAKGAFEQAIKGIKNLIAISNGNIVINIDVCVNKQNYKKLPDIIKFFQPFGIYEFDLLHIIPFGNSLGNKKALFYNYEEAKPFLKEAFSFSKQPGYFIWTNRFPAPYCEDYENLIQDPHKFHDEILGRSELYEQFYRDGKFSCYPHHCPFCFVKKYCRKFVYYIDQIELPNNIKILKAQTIDNDFIKFINDKPQIDSITISLSVKNLVKIQSELSSLTHLNSITFKQNSIDIERVESQLDELCQKLAHLQIEIEIGAFNNVSLENIKALQEKNIRVIILLNHSGSQFVVNNLQGLSAIYSQIELKIPTYEKGSLAKKQYQNLFLALDNSPKEITIQNCSPCLHKGGYFRSSRHLNLDIIEPNNSIDEQTQAKVANTPVFREAKTYANKPNIKKLVSDFLENDYYAKSTRCKDCKLNESCKGMHINFIRNFGFKKMQIIK